MRLSKRRIRLACDLRRYKTLHGVYCKWKSIDWNGLKWDEVDTVYVHLNNTKYIIKIERALRRL